MFKVFVSALLVLVPVPAIAQDAISQDAANNAVIMSAEQGVRDYGLRASQRGRSRGYNRTARTCANVPSVRRRLGASDPRVRRLTQLCRRAGY